MIPVPNTYFSAEEAKTVSTPVYIFTLDAGNAGEYEIPQADIIDPGQITTQRPTDFTDLTSGDHTLVLNNQSGIYSPGRSDFIWAGDTWFRRSIKIEMGYRRPGYKDTVDKVTLFEGFIVEWKLTESKDFTHDSPVEGLMVEITSRDHISLLLERFIGAPEDDPDDDNFGMPKPSVYGSIFWDAVELADTRLWAPDQTAGFEDGTLNELTETMLYGTGAITVSTTDPYSGNYCAKAVVSAANDKALLCLNPGSAQNEALWTAMIKMVNIPNPLQSGNNYIMLFYDQGSAGRIIASPDSSGYVWLSILGTWYKTDWNIFSTEDQWVRLTYGYRTAYDWFKFWVDGDCVYSAYGDWSAYQWAKSCIGVWNYGGYAESWEMYVDDLKLDYQAYVNGYYIPGYPYDSIDKVWIDGANTPKEKPYYDWQKPYVNNLRKAYKNTWAGKRFPYDNYNTYPQYGMVDLIPQAEMPSGQIMFQATKDTNTHPVDIIEDILTEVGLDAIVDADSFAACKANCPNDTIGSYFDNVQASQAISDICGRVLYDLIEPQGSIRLVPYFGYAKEDYSLVIDKSNCWRFEQNINMNSLITVTQAKWAWYEKYPRYFYQAEDATLKALLGTQAREIDLTFGQSVMSESAIMSRNKADLLLNRLRNGSEAIIASGDLSWARVEIGDGVLVQNSNINDDGLIYECFEKVVDLTNKTVTLTVIRFPGEAVVPPTGEYLLINDTDRLITSGTDCLLIN